MSLRFFWFVLIFSENFKLFGHNCLVFIMLSLRLINIQKNKTISRKYINKGILEIGDGSKSFWA